MRDLSISIPVEVGETSSTTTDVFPYRPAFGTFGNPVILWANYFKLDIKSLPLFMYALTVTYVNIEEGDVATPKSGKSGKGSKGAKGTPKGTPKDAPMGGAAKATKAAGSIEKKAAGRKLHRIVGDALKQVGSSVFATEYKSQVISRGELKLTSNPIRVKYKEPGRDRVELWDVKLDGPTSLRLGTLMTYLGSMMDPEGDTNFPKYAAEIDALNVILGHQARSDNSVVAVGRNRFFAADGQRVERSGGLDYGPIDILRGYFQSVRTATGRLLLNVNVTAGVFRRPIPIAELFTKMGLDRIDKIRELPPYDRNRYLTSLRTVHKLLKRARITLKVLPVAAGGKAVLQEKVVTGLASSRDKAVSVAQKPMFQFNECEFGGPKMVKFFLNEPTGTDQTRVDGLAYNQHILVAEYHRAREFFFFLFVVFVVVDHFFVAWANRD